MTFSRSPTLRRVLAGDLCTGCGLCAAVSGGAITMKSVAPGWLRPSQNGPVSQEAEHKIATSCPGAVVAPWGGGLNVHPYWGPYLRISTGFATDADVRFKGSSGGAITGLALHALASGFADRILHVLPNQVDPAANAIAVSATAQDVILGAGSRYVASSPLQALDAILSEPGTLVFIGKPCDVSALRQLAKIDARVDAKVRLMLSFFCAGVPSRRAVGRVVDAMGISAGDLATFRFRGDGWPGKARATTHDGRVETMSYEESWGGYLSKEVQFRCKICPDAVGGVADIACADAWYGGESGYPTFEELDGRSLIVSRTRIGEQFLAQAEADRAVSMTPLNIDEIDLMQPSQARRKRLVRGRMVALAMTLRPRPSMKGLLVEKASTRANPLEQLRNFVGSVRRSLMRGPTGA